MQLILAGSRPEETPSVSVMAELILLNGRVDGPPIEIFWLSTGTPGPARHRYESTCLPSSIGFSTPGARSPSEVREEGWILEGCWFWVKGDC